MAVLLVFSIVSLAVFFQSKPLTRFARSLIQGSRPPTATFEHFTGEGVMVTVALASAMIYIIDKTFGYLLRGEISLDNLASKN